MIIVLKDKQTLQDELDQGHPIDGLESFVEEEFVLSESNGLVTWTIFRLKDKDLIYVKKQVEDLVDHFVFIKPEGLVFGSKEDWIKAGHDWLFDGENYPEEIYQNGNIFKILGGSYTCSTEVGDKTSSKVISNCLVTEWVTDVEHDNPRIICIEIGNYIEFYQGCQILESEVEFL
jgi:hypothetical protein